MIAVPRLSYSGRRLLAGAALLLVAAVGAPAGAAPAAPPDLVLITIDTWRADAAPWRQGPLATPAPALAQLAAQGRIYTFAHAHNTVTLPSHLNILTGLYPYQHGVRDNAGFVLPARLPTLAGILAGKGYDTAGFVSALTLDRRFGVDRGFATFDQPAGGGRRGVFEVAERRAQDTVALALAWWKKGAGRPRFLWLHLFDPHAPYDPPEPWRSQYREQPYRGEIAAADHFLSALLEELKRGNERRPLFLALTGDHGEGLGDHGEANHGSFAWESTLAVPLLLWGQGVAPGEDDRLARQVDLAPTFLAVAGLPKPPAWPGVSLLAPPVAELTSYFEALTGHFSFGWAPLRGLLQGRSKIYEKPLPELYDLAADPGETRNRVDEERRKLNTLRKLLPQESTWPPARAAAVEPDVAATLRSLGYLSEGAPSQASYGPADDPHRLAAVESGIVAAKMLYVAGRFEEAAAKAQEVLQLRPRVPAAYSLRTQALLEAGKRIEALGAIDAAIAAKSASPELWQQLGLTLLEAKQPAAAAGRLQPEVERGGDPRLRAVYGLALSALGRAGEAWAELQKAEKDAPGDPEVLERMSVVALENGRNADAERTARAATVADPGRAYAWNNLGVALYLRGARQEALDAWEKAVAVAPEMWDTWFNLGTKAAEMGEKERARRALEVFVAKAPPREYRAELAEARRLLGG